MCECFNKIIDSIKEEMKDKNEVNVEWQNKTYFLNGGDHAPTVLQVNTEHRRIKTNGQKYQKVTKDYVRCVLKYCPFCGKRIEEEK